MDVFPERQSYSRVARPAHPRELSVRASPRAPSQPRGRGRGGLEQQGDAWSLQASGKPGGQAGIRRSAHTKELQVSSLVPRTQETVHALSHRTRLWVMCDAPSSRTVTQRHPEINPWSLASEKKQERRLPLLVGLGTAGWRADVWAGAGHSTDHPQPT